LRCAARNGNPARRVQHRPFGVRRVVAVEPVVFVFPQAPQIGVMDGGWLLFLRSGVRQSAAILFLSGNLRRTAVRRYVAGRQFHEQHDGHAHGDVEDVVVLRAVGRSLLFLGRAVEVEDVNLIEGFQQALAHPPVREPSK